MSFMVNTSFPPREFVGIAQPGQTRPTRRRFPWLELIWADGGCNAGQVEALVAKMPVLRVGIVKRSDDMSGFVVPPLVRQKSSPGQGLRKPRRDPGHLRNHRLHPACCKAAGQGLGREVKLPVAACHWGGCKRRDKVARYVITNDRDATMSGRWDGPELTGQIDP